MTGTFDDREKGFEGKFSHDRELSFKVRARLKKLLGLWAAEQLGLMGEDAEAYAREVVVLDLGKKDGSILIERLLEDFKGKNLDISDYRLQKEISRLTEIAVQQIHAESQQKK